MTTEQARLLIAFDFGMKRTGVAIGQTLTQQARPLDTLIAHQGKPNWQAIEKLIHKWMPDAFVVGIPLNMDGSDQFITQHAKAFAHELRARFSLPVYEMDERLTTKAAREHLFREGGYQALQGGQVDRVAAQLILENWFAENL